MDVSNNEVNSVMRPTFASITIQYSIFLQGDNVSTR